MSEREELEAVNSVAEFLRYCQAHSKTDRPLFSGAQVKRALTLAGRQEEAATWNGREDVFVAVDLGDVATALLPSGYVEGDGELPDWMHFCANCGRIIDGREKDAGGDDHGAEVGDNTWACSHECYCALTEGEG